MPKRYRSGAYKRAYKRRRMGTKGFGRVNATRRLSLSRNRFGSGAVHSFTRMTMCVPYAVTDVPGMVNKAVYFCLSQLPSYSEICSTYDRYRITKVQMYFMFDHNASECEASTTQPLKNLPLLYVVKDYDDATPTAGEDEYVQYNPCKIVRLGNGKGAFDCVVTIKPRIATAAYGGGAFTSYVNTAAPWIDANSADVQHYGIKFGYICPQTPGTGTKTVGFLRTWTKMWFECCDTH